MEVKKKIIPCFNRYQIHHGPFLFEYFHLQLQLESTDLKKMMDLTDFDGGFVIIFS